MRFVEELSNCYNFNIAGSICGTYNKYVRKTASFRSIGTSDYSYVYDQYGRITEQYVVTNYVVTNTDTSVTRFTYY